MFAMISFLIALPCLLKGVTALVMPDRFYHWRRTTQYGSEKVPPSVLVMPGFIALLAGASWYALFTQYHAWGWIVTGFTTLVALLAVVNLSRWSSHRKKVGQAIDTQPDKRIAVDGLLVSLGIAFLALGIFVY